MAENGLGKELVKKILVAVVGWLIIFFVIIKFVPMISLNSPRGKAMTTTYEFLDAIGEGNPYEQFLLSPQIENSEIEDFFIHGQFLSFKLVDIGLIEDGVWDKRDSEKSTKGTVEIGETNIKLHYIMQFEDLWHQKDALGWEWNDFVHVIITVDLESWKVSDVQFGSRIRIDRW